MTQAGQQSAAQQASGSSFYLGMRILPPPQRAAMFEIYAFCRKVDDIADDGGAKPQRLAQLQQWRDDLDAIYAGTPPAHAHGLDHDDFGSNRSKIMNVIDSDSLERDTDGKPLRTFPHPALAKAVRDFSLAKEDFLAIIDGMQMDVESDIRAPDLATLDLYCDRVACAVGRLSVRVFGMDEVEGIALAHHLGMALQLTNILRDLDEDARIGRLYLPRELLGENAITETDPAAVLANPALGTVCARLVERIRAHFREADAIMRRAPRKTVRTPKVMAEAYKLILDGLIARGWSPPRAKVRVGRLRLMWILARHAVI